jgi:hypothetical protein
MGDVQPVVRGRGRQEEAVVDQVLDHRCEQPTVVEREVRPEERQHPDDGSAEHRDAHQEPGKPGIRLVGTGDRRYLDAVGGRRVGDRRYASNHCVKSNEFAPSVGRFTPPPAGRRPIGYQVSRFQPEAHDG